MSLPDNNDEARQQHRKCPWSYRIGSKLHPSHSQAVRCYNRVHSQPLQVPDASDTNFMMTDLYRVTALPMTSWLP